MKVELGIRMHVGLAVQVGPQGGDICGPDGGGRPQSGAILGLTVEVGLRVELYWA